MNLYIFENFSNKIEFGNIIYHLNKFGIIFFLISILLLLLSNKDYRKIQLNILLFSAGLYIFYSDFIDESFVSPRMSYILNNHLSFSFFENFKNQASVEILQTIISAPFFKTTSSITLSYYITHLFLTLVVVFYFVKIIPQEELKQKKNILITLIILFLSFNFFKSSSSGLGLNLMSIFVFFSIYCFYKKNIFFHKLSYSLLPLIRPDGILYAGIFIISNIIHEKKIDIKPIFLSVLSFGLYFLIVNFYYDQWPPPPMAFKSFPISSIIESIQDPLKYFEILVFIKDHLFQLFVICFFALFFMFKFGFNLNLYKNFLSIYIFELSLFLGFIGILLFYNFLSFHQHGDFRYSMIVTMFLSLITLRIIIISKIFKKKYLVLLTSAAIAHLYFGLSNLEYIFSDKKIAQNTYFESYKFAAMKLKDLKIEKKIKIASVEMASFPFYLERDVSDLYGYSNLDISESNLCNFNNSKVNPDYIKEEKPDLIFERAVPNIYFKLLNENEEFIDRVLSLENYLLQDYFSKEEYNYGDLNYLLNTYDFVLLKYQKMSSLFLVEKNYLNEFKNKLENNHYRFLEEKFFNKEKFLRLYNSLPDKIKNC